MRGGARFEGSEVLRKLTPPRTPHLLRYPTPHQTEGRKKKVQDITLFQPKMRDHRSRRLRALPFFINFIQTNTQGDARDTRTPVPTPKPRGQGGGVLRGSFGLRRLRDAPPKGFHFFQKEIQEDYLTINPSSSQRSCQSLAPSQRNTCPLTRRFPFSRVPILAISSSVSGSSVTHFRLLT